MVPFNTQPDPEVSDRQLELEGEQLVSWARKDRSMVGMFFAFLGCAY